jgi:hypothetical protein
MTDREIDAAVAVKVLGWRNDGLWLYDDYPNGNCEVLRLLDFQPTTNPADDYRVLEHVRGEWAGDQKWAMRQELSVMWVDRMPTDTPLDPALFNYRPGDYARAALAALTPG